MEEEEGEEEVKVLQVTLTLFVFLSLAESRWNRPEQLPGDGRDGLHEAKARL